jgi:hypothetical protein
MRMSWLEGYIGERKEGRTSSIRDGQGCISTSEPLSNEPLSSKPASDGDRTKAEQAEAGRSPGSPYGKSFISVAKVVYIMRANSRS